jgi:hypothetical protein
MALLFSLQGMEDLEECMAVGNVDEDDDIKHDTR